MISLGFCEQLFCPKFSKFFQQLLPRLARRSDFIERFANLLRQVPDMGGKQTRGFGQRAVVVPRRGDGSLSADEFHTPSRTNFLYLARSEERRVGKAFRSA